MTRTVAALYQSRAEAEFARERLIADVRANSPRIIGKDTAAAIDGLGLSPRDADSYRQGVSQGGHLLVAQVPRGTSSKILVNLLKSAKGRAEDSADVRVPEAGGVQVKLPAEQKADLEPEPRAGTAASAEAPQEPGSGEAAPAVARPREAQPAPPAADLAQPVPAPDRPVQGAAIPVAQGVSPVRKPDVARDGARVRAFTREAPVEEQVELSDETVEVESRSSGRRVSPADVETGGLFKERIFEIAEMREEAVVTKEAFVREEVIVRKNVNTRTETIHDTVRHTEVEVEDLPGSSESTPALFGHSRGTRR